MKGQVTHAALLLIGCLLLSTSPSILSAESREPYSKLETMLDEGTSPDSSVVETLPEPASAREFWLRARVESDFSSARAFLKKSIQRSKDPESQARYLITMLRISLLQGVKKEDASLYRKHVRRLQSRIEVPDRLWYLAGKWFLRIEEYETAASYFSSVDRESSFYARALLSRAEALLESETRSEANKVLREYFISDFTESRPRYWLIKGRWFEQSNADSEAYVAYSHVINHYPESLLRKEAEMRISRLPLPESLYPDRSPKSLTREPKLRGQRAESTPQQKKSRSQSNSGQFEIQVGSFRKSDHAQSLRRSLRSWISYPVTIQKANVDGQTYLRVKIQGIENEEQAEKTLEKVKSSGYSGFITASNS